MKNIFLVGMPGSGKSTLGKEIADALHVEHIDTDEMIKKSIGLTPEEIILLNGEPKLRKIEHELLLSLLNRENLVISTGGGLPVYDDNMMMMNESAITLYIKYSEEILWDRIKNDRFRPLSSNHESVVGLLRKRERVYGKATITIDGEDDITQNTQNAVNAIITQLNSEIPRSDKNDKNI